MEGVEGKDGIQIEEGVGVCEMEEWNVGTRRHKGRRGFIMGSGKTQR